MHLTILLSATENTRRFEATEQARFVSTVLDWLEVPIEWNPDEEMTVEAKQRYRKTLSDFSVSVVDDSDGGVEVFASNELVGRWDKCTYTLKQDTSQPDPRKRLYMEANVNFWAKFEDLDDEPSSSPGGP